MSNLCFRCVKLVNPVSMIPVPDPVECEGCGGTCFGAAEVPALDDIQRQRCKNGGRDLQREVFDACNADTPRSTEWGGSGEDGGVE